MDVKMLDFFFKQCHGTNHLQKMRLGAPVLACVFLISHSEHIPVDWMIQTWRSSRRKPPCAHVQMESGQIRKRLEWIQSCYQRWIITAGSLRGRCCLFFLYVLKQQSVHGECRLSRRWHTLYCIKPGLTEKILSKACFNTNYLVAIQVPHLNVG